MSRVTVGNNGITKGYSSTHKGIDIGWHSVELDNQIKAHSEGTVVWVQTGQKNNKNATGNKSYGNAIKIKHNNGMYTLYAHLKSVKVKKGQNVVLQQIIGIMGNTGKSYGRHCHFEVRDKNDKRINPTMYLNADLPKTNTGKRYMLLFAKYFRTAASATSKAIKKLPVGTIIQSIDDKIYTSKTGSKWIKCTLSGKTGYVCIADKSGKQAKEV